MSCLFAVTSGRAPSRCNRTVARQETHIISHVFGSCVRLFLDFMGVHNFNSESGGSDRTRFQILTDMVEAVRPSTSGVHAPAACNIIMIAAERSVGLSLASLTPVRSGHNLNHTETNHCETPGVYTSSCQR